MTEVYTRLIKAITGNGTGSVKITPTPGKRLHGIGIRGTYASGVSTAGDTLAEQLAAISEIRVLVGSRVRRRITGTRLRDYMLLNGTTYDFDAVSTYVYQMYIPFAEDWFVANVADSLAWNPAILGAPITVEIDISVLNTSYYPTLRAFERVSDDLDAPSAGIITLETINPVAGGTSFYVERELAPVGRLIQASIYPDSGGSNEITPASLFIGPNDAYAWEALTSAENDDVLGRAGLTPAASGRTANIYDMVFVRGDALAHAIDLERAGRAKMQIEAASAMSGTCPIVLARLESR